MDSGEEEILVCDECGIINGCEHIVLDYVEETDKANVFEPNIQNELENFTEETLSEMLISFVSLHPPLWDHRLPLTKRTKPIKDQLWVEILSEFGDNTDLTLAILQKKWKNLRDKYMKTKAEIETYTPSGSAAKKKKKKIWKHFDAMSFLSDTVTPRTTVSSHSTDCVRLVSTPSPSESNDTCKEYESTPTLHKRKSKTGKDDEIANIILKAVDKMSSTDVPPTNTSKNYNPICERISELLENALEIKLLSTTYDVAKEHM